jgi:aminoglycoside/choline kinase family phosphotransferase
MRDAAKKNFLARAGWADAEIAPLAGDASNRKYERVRRPADGARAVLMDAPPDAGEALTPFLSVGAHLAERGYAPPRTFFADTETGFALIEDLGDDLYARVCDARPGMEAKIYAAAVDLLADIARAPPPKVLRWEDAETPLPPYDAAVLQREAALAVEWWAPAASDDWPEAAASEFGELIAAATADVAAARSVIVLRDYHAENLLWLPERAGHARVGLLDYQDALAGHPAYDLVSLLEDARRDTSDELREAMIDRYLGAAEIEDARRFASDYATLGAQRNLKIIGIFARLWLRDGKPGYLDMIPRIWTHLLRDLSHPHLRDLRAFVERWMPEPTPEAIGRVRSGRG